MHKCGSLCSREASTPSPLMLWSTFKTSCQSSITKWIQGQFLHFSSSIAPSSLVLQGNPFFAEGKRQLIFQSMTAISDGPFYWWQCNFWLLGVDFVRHCKLLVNSAWRTHVPCSSLPHSLLRAVIGRNSAIVEEVRNYRELTTLKVSWWLFRHLELVVALPWKQDRIFFSVSALKTLKASREIPKCEYFYI